MGLDMYLTRRTYIETNKKRLIKVSKELEIKQSKISYIIEDIGYWRKANAIHKWFVDNIQSGEDNCKEYWVTQENMKNLLEIIKKVLIDPENKGPELLPATEGFFFGDTNYDEWYIENLKTTEKILETAIKEPNHEYYYQSSW